MMSPRAVKTLGGPALLGAALSNFSAEKTWFAEPVTFHACKGVSAKNLKDPGEASARLIGENSNVNCGHVSASQLERTLTAADGAGR